MSNPKVAFTVISTSFTPGDFGRGSAGTYRIEGITSNGEKYIVYTSSEKWYGARDGWTGEVSFKPCCVSQGPNGETVIQSPPKWSMQGARVRTIRVSPPSK